MPDLQTLSDQELINTSHHLRHVALRGSGDALSEAQRHEAELRRRFGKVDRAAAWNGLDGHVKERAKPSPEPLTLTAATEKFIIATADTATQSGEALRDLLHNLRVLLKMDIAFVAELVNGQKVYRELDHAEASKVSVQSGATAPLETTLCQRVVDGRAPQIMRDARSDPSLADLAAVHAMDIGAYLSTPVVLRDGSVYGTLCCISHTSRSALGSRQLDSLRYVAEIVAAELEKRRG
ncbi:MAG: GAF domain-containing protein [Pseudomonas sp.]|uniref:GAF domain-containing protein n=1 Tax=Pseudomonas sp. TaxID=306 RepID=UPI00120C8833|nr:GAF domain-containing protein [Pseudomonas sp.]RZI74794.1 MAG: GAF domain-containing protein [Pseudomonas sp.]